MSKPLVIDHATIPITTQKQVRLRELTLDIPLRYTCDAVNAVFPVSTDRMKELIGYSQFKPLEIIPGRSLLCVTFFDFSTTPVGPYSEMTLSTPISYKQKLSLPGLTLVKDMLCGTMRFFVILIAQSTALAIEHGNLINGYPHYENPIRVDFKRDSDALSIRSHSGGQEIMSLAVTNSRRERILKESHTTFLMNRSEVFTIRMDTYGIIGPSRVLQCSLGDHEIAQRIKKLGFSSASVNTRSYRNTLKVINERQSLGKI